MGKKIKPKSKQLNVSNVQNLLSNFNELIPPNLSQNPIVTAIHGGRIDTSQDKELFEGANFTWESLDEIYRETVGDTVKIAQYVYSISEDKELLSQLTREEFTQLNNSFVVFAKDFKSFDERATEINNMHKNAKGLITSMNGFNLYNKCSIQYVELKLLWATDSESTISIIADLIAKAEERLSLIKTPLVNNEELTQGSV